MAKRTTASPSGPSLPLANPYLALGLAWLIPGLGHVFLGRRGRGVIFCLIILITLGIGVSIDGRLPWYFSESPLAVLATLGAMGSGLPCLVLHFVFGYVGDLTAAGYEYGGTFIITAGLMNFLLALDAWDIAWGKELEREEIPEDSSK